LNIKITQVFNKSIIGHKFAGKLKDLSLFPGFKSNIIFSTWFIPCTMLLKDTKLRSLIKGISWRCLGTIDTFVLAYIFLGSIKFAAPIAGVEVFTKIFLYYFHERGWNLVKWGREQNIPTHTRSIMKGISWRIIGSFDTMTISYLVSGNPWGALKIGTTEVFTKIGLFYIHERIWALIPWGRLLIKVEEVRA
jgi:uncharacterized membrane protein